MTELISQVKMQGFLKIVAREVATGRIVFAEEKPNMVVVGTKGVLARLLTQLAGNPVNYDRIWGIYVGDSNLAPTTSQTALQGTHVTKKAINQPMTIVSPAESSGIVEAEATLGASDHVDQYIREVGLFSRGNNNDPSVTTGAQMMARQIHGEIYKTAAITVTYTWRFQITV